mmetsp:Transcript_11328/g.18586  ORF Transcript_11328/g.18586 Transcript_11328/m.18586 type:complete len:1123 (-) Transcript_11328:2451-5819(-)
MSPRGMKCRHEQTFHVKRNNVSTPVPERCTQKRFWIQGPACPEEYVMSLMGMEPRAAREKHITQNVCVKQEDLALVHLFRSMVMRSGVMAIRSPSCYSNKIVFTRFPHAEEKIISTETVLDSVGGHYHKVAFDFDLKGLEMKGLVHDVFKTEDLQWMCRLVIEKTLNILHRCFKSFSVEDGSVDHQSNWYGRKGLAYSTFSKPRTKLKKDDLKWYESVKGVDKAAKLTAMKTYMQNNKDSFGVKMGLHVVFAHIYLTSKQHRLLCAMLTQEMKHDWSSENNPMREYFMPDQFPSFDSIFDSEISRNGVMSLKDVWNVKTIAVDHSKSTTVYTEHDSQHLPLSVMECVVTDEIDLYAKDSEFGEGMQYNYKLDSNEGLVDKLSYGEMGFAYRKRWLFMLNSSMSFRYKTNIDEIVKSDEVQAEIDRVFSEDKDKSKHYYFREEESKCSGMEMDEDSDSDVDVIDTHVISKVFVVRNDVWTKHSADQEFSNNLLYDSLKKQCDASETTANMVKGVAGYMQYSEDQINSVVNCASQVQCDNKKGTTDKFWITLTDEGFREMFPHARSTRETMAAYILEYHLYHLTDTYSRVLYKEMRFQEWLHAQIVEIICYGRRFRETILYFCKILKKSCIGCNAKQSRLRRKTIKSLEKCAKCIRTSTTALRLEHSEHASMIIEITYRTLKRTRLPLPVFKQRCVWLCNRVNSVARDEDYLNEIGVACIERDLDMEYLCNYYNSGWEGGQARNAIYPTPHLLESFEEEIKYIAKNTTVEMHKKDRNMRYKFPNLNCRVKSYQHKMGLAKSPNHNSKKTTTYVTHHLKLLDGQTKCGKFVTLRQECHSSACAEPGEPRDGDEKTRESCKAWMIDDVAKRNLFYMDLVGPETIGAKESMWIAEELLRSSSPESSFIQDDLKDSDDDNKSQNLLVNKVEAKTVTNMCTDDSGFRRFVLMDDIPAGFFGSQAVIANENFNEIVRSKKKKYDNDNLYLNGRKIVTRIDTANMMYDDFRKARGCHKWGDFVKMSAMESESERRMVTINYVNATNPQNSNYDILVQLSMMSSFVKPENLDIVPQCVRTCFSVVLMIPKSIVTLSSSSMLLIARLFNELTHLPSMTTSRGSSVFNAARMIH